MQPQGKTARTTSASRKAPQQVQNALPSRTTYQPPFVFLDRLHLAQLFSRVTGRLRNLLAQGGGSLRVVMAFLLVVYLAGALYFSGHFLPGTRIGGMPASFGTPESVATQAKARLGGYQLTVEGEGLSLTLDGQGLGLSFDEDAFAQGAAAHMAGFAWPARLLASRSYSVAHGVTFDEGRVHAAVSEAVSRANEQAEPTSNASLAYQPDKGSFVIVDEQWGTTLDEQAVEARVSQAIASLENHLELDKQVLVQPTLFANDPRMAAALNEANARKDLALDLTVWGEVVRTLEPHALRSWFALDDECSLTGDLEALTAWAQGPLSTELDSVGSTRAYTRPDDGKYCEVSGGTYGWIVDGAALAQLICDRIAEGSSEPVEIPMKSEGVVFAPGAQDWGARYLDVDLSEQYVRLYDSGSNLIFASECVSGDPGVGNDTVTGVYAIYDKESPKKLIGLDSDGDGEPDYENDVQYWMPFYGGYGLHDATWRSYFGADAYLYGGSHGCVNLPLESAQLLYELIQVDDTVVVHY